LPPGRGRVPSRRRLAKYPARFRAGLLHRKAP
jgi:hypothetical protein